jgi:type IV pilus assembly protein PilW
MNTSLTRHARSRGFSLVELMVALALGLLLTTAMIYVYVSSKTAFSRQQQMSSLQQSVRIAFEYLASDTRMVGHMGCFTGLATVSNNDFNTPLSTTALASNYALGVEGYEYVNTATDAYTMTADVPANVTATANWQTNTAAAPGINTIPATTIGGAATGDGLTPGSDVLVIRTVAGRPVRLSADTTSNATTLSVENLSTGKCSDGSDKLAGFCANSHGLIASCTRARVFQVSSKAGQTLTMTNALASAGAPGADPIYRTAASEVFPLQTIVYYVKQASNGTTTSLYRRIFDGTVAAGTEQELIEGVENLQLRYGIDTTVPDADGIVDSYVNANAVTDWNRVVAVRMGLLIRSTQSAEAGMTFKADGIVNGVTLTYPTTGGKYDRRVFTTTVAARNKISYFQVAP